MHQMLGLPAGTIQNLRDDVEDNKDQKGLKIVVT
jgi:hypothetical protein